MPRLQAIVYLALALLCASVTALPHPGENSAQSLITRNNDNGYAGIDNLDDIGSTAGVTSTPSPAAIEKRDISLPAIQLHKRKETAEQKLERLTSQFTEATNAYSRSAKVKKDGEVGYDMVARARLLRAAKALKDHRSSNPGAVQSLGLSREPFYPPGA